MIPYSLHCTTCRAALRVSDAAAIGQILPCPKCGSMVQVVPPLDRPAATSRTATRPVEVLAFAAHLRPSGVDIEQFAAEGAAMLPDDARVRLAIPPPLPREISAAPAGTTAGFARPGVLFLASAAAAILAVGVIAWAVWSYRGGDEVSLAAAASQSTSVRNEHQLVPEAPDSTTKSDAIESPAGSILPPNGVALPHDNSEVNSVGAETPIESAVDSSTLLSEAPATERNSLSEPKADTDNSSAGDGTSAVAKSVSAGKPSDADQGASDDRNVRRPALKLEELPRSDLPGGDPVATQSVGQQAGEGAEQESPPDPPAQPGPPDENANPDTPADPATPPVRRVAPQIVDVPARLTTKIAAINFRGAPLHKALETISDLAGVPIGLDVDGVRAMGVQVDQAVTVVGKSLTVGLALEQALRPLGLMALEQNGHLLVQSAGAGQTRKARYAVDDLVRTGDPPIEDLVEVVRAVVAGRPTTDDGVAILVTAENGAIFLTAREVEHDRMIELSEKLRVARGRPLRSRFNAMRPDPRFDPRRFELATRRAKAQDLLATPVTAGVGRPAPFCDVVEFLAEQTAATILVDRPALAAAGLAVGTDARLIATGQPIAATLERLLAPLGLTFRVVDNKLLEISTPDAAAKRICIEFYPVRGLFEGRASAAEDVELYREKLLSAAGITDSKAAIVFDPPSECLIVSASYLEQVRIEQAMRKLDRP